MTTYTALTLGMVASVHALIFSQTLTTPETKTPSIALESNVTKSLEVIEPIIEVITKGNDVTIKIPTKLKEVACVPTLDDIDFKKFSEALKFSESSGRKHIINPHGYIGWYQIGMAKLEDLGYIKKGEYARMKKSGLGQKTFIKNYVKWNHGLSLRKFLKTEQDIAFKKICTMNYKSLKKYNYLDTLKDKRDLQGILFGAHLVGLTATKK